MMIIYTNEGNPFSLKLLLCAKFAKKDVILKKVNLNDDVIKEPKHLPKLELESGNQIFSTDAAVKYLLPVENSTVLRDQWLEWSTIRLAPALSISTTGNRSNLWVKDLLNELIKTLNESLRENKYLTGNSLSSADLSVWSLLATSGYPLKDIPNCNHLLEWYNGINDLSEVKESLEILPLKDLNFASLQQSNKYGGIQHILSDSGNLNNLSNVSPKTNKSVPEKEPIIVDTIIEKVTSDEIKLAKSSFIYVKQTPFKENPIVLPIPGKKNVLITSALPYVNNVPHLGNIIGCVLSADIFARYSRLIGNNTLFICGTDEYGTATETKALSENLTPQQICDKYFKIHDSIYKWFNISFNYFGRTTTNEQTTIVQGMFNELNEAGYLDIESIDQLLCTKCNRYLADRFVEGTCPHPGCGYEDARGDQCDGCSKLINAIELIRPRCKVCNETPIVKKANQFFFNLTKIEPRLREWFATVKNGWSHNACSITKSWFKEGLRPRCITRDLKWGIPVPYPEFENKVFYVWFDAPIGYVSITNNYTKEWRQWWQPKDENVKVTLYQFMAKDNVPFHSVMFPATLLGINKGYTTVSHIMATEYLNYEDGKFSKSRGIGVFGNDAQDTGISADVWRFYLAACRPEGQDANFNWNDLVARNNSELLNNVGNFINRALVFCEKYFNSIVPTIQSLTDDDLNFLALVNRDFSDYIKSMNIAKFRDAIKYCLSISRNGNQYLHSQQPWVLLKDTDVKQKERAGTVIAICCNLTCLLANLLLPFIPETCENIFKQLNKTATQVINSDKPQIIQYFENNHKIGKPMLLFTKIEQSCLDELKKKYGGAQQQQELKQQQSQNNSAIKIVFKTIDEAEQGITQQGEKVRQLKQANPTEKSVWQPDVAILLDYKKQLASLKQQHQQKKEQVNVTTKINATSNDILDVKELEKMIVEQGNKVRQLKSSKTDKSILQPEIDLLLSFKKQFIIASGGGVATTTSTKANNRGKGSNSGKSKKK